MAKARRTPAQIAAAKRNLEKARAARKKAAQRDPKRFTKALAKRRKDQAKAEGSSETLGTKKLRLQQLKKALKDTETDKYNRYGKTAWGSGGKGRRSEQLSQIAHFKKEIRKAEQAIKTHGTAKPKVKINAKKTRQERVGGRAWAAKEAGGTVPLSSFRPGSRVRVSARTGRTFTQTRRQAIMGIRVYDKPKTRRRRK